MYFFQCPRQSTKTEVVVLFKDFRCLFSHVLKPPKGSSTPRGEVIASPILNLSDFRAKNSGTVDSLYIGSVNFLNKIPCSFSSCCG